MKYVKNGIFHHLTEQSTTTMTPEKIKERIEAGLTDATAQVDGDGAHFTAIVICPQFADKSRVQKQQLVYDTVKSELMDGTLHALSVKTYTPDEWTKAKTS